MWNKSVTEIIKRRVSIRSYKGDVIPDERLNKILEAGLYAPSGKNRQPWRFVVIKDKSIIKDILKLTVRSRFIRNSPVLVLLYIERSDDYAVEKDILSVGACVQNILLAATEKGYGTCVIGELFGKEQAADKILSSTFSNNILICGITIGKILNKLNKNRSFKFNDFVLGSYGSDILL